MDEATALYSRRELFLVSLREKKCKTQEFAGEPDFLLISEPAGVIGRIEDATLARDS